MIDKKSKDLSPEIDANAYYHQLSWEKRQARKAAAEKEKEQERLLQLREDEHFMRQALAQARKALALGEVPIGCVIVYQGKIIGRGYNRRNTDHSTLSHAEIRAIRKASTYLHDWRLEGCTLYCTLEPCPMCSGAIEQARIDRVVLGAPSDKSGCAGTLLNVVNNEKLMHRSEVTWGVLTGECRAILREFFQNMRNQNAAPSAPSAPSAPKK